MASHILQLVYLTPGGFRFPVAHFATKDAQAPELIALLWRGVDLLQERGFKVKMRHQCIFYELSIATVYDKDVSYFNIQNVHRLY